MLGHGCQDVNGQLVRVWVIDGDELDTGIHQRGNKCQIAREAIELGDHKLRPMLFAGRECRHELRSGLDGPLNRRPFLDRESRRVELRINLRASVDLDPLLRVDDASNRPRHGQPADAD